MENIKICIWDWKSYNEGASNWEWFSLPEDAGLLQDHLDAMKAEGLEEPFICDSDGHEFIQEHTNINKLIELAEELQYMDTVEFIQTYHETPQYVEYLDLIPLDQLDVYLEGGDFSPPELFNLMVRNSFDWTADYFLHTIYGIETRYRYQAEELREQAFNEAATEFLRQ